jgi:VCBS repeat protein
LTLLLTGNPAREYVIQQVSNSISPEGPLRFPAIYLSLLVAVTSLPCTLPAATVSFSHKTVTFPDQDFPTGIVADLNNDGREDLVSMIGDVQTGGTGVFVVRLSTGDGTYGSPKQYVLPNSSAGFTIVIGDFNNDGSADIAFSGGNDAQGDVIFMYLNDGKGNFTLHGTIPIPGGGLAVAAADFNHDRLMDLAYIANGGLHILFGNGKGGFTQGPVTPVNSDNEPLLVGDYDGDGMADIAWGDYVNYTTATVLYGDNTGHFVPKYVTFPEKVVFSTGDVNSDGRTDLIGSPGLVKHLDIFYGNTARTFANHSTVALKACATNSAAATDLDGNGISDLVVLEEPCNFTGGPPYSNTIGVLTRNNNGSYNPDQTIYSVINSQYGGIAYGPTILRGDRNSKPDIAFGVCSDPECLGTNYQILLNTTSGHFPACAPPNAFEGINVCSPSSSPSSPVAFHVGAAGQVPMRKVEVWVDGTKKVEQLDGFSRYSFLDKSISMTPGSHKVTIFAASWDNWLEQKTFTLSVR